MQKAVLINNIREGALDARLAALYGEGAVCAQRARYLTAIERFAEHFGEERELALFSVPGRSELGGNHTDHNRGAVLATSVHPDIIAVVAAREDRTVCVHSEGFPEDVVELDAFCEARTERYGRSDALIAGLCRGFADRGFAVGGFDAYTTSDVPGGSGLSSSAAFEVMIGNILNHLYNGGKIDNVEIAKLSQWAENVFFGKPCGLMDQLACAVGGIVAIDFADPTTPVIERIDMDLTANGYALCITNTGGNHADLTPDYAAVPREMRDVAKALGGEVLRDVTREALMASIVTLREQVGDRAILRAMHYFGENDRVTVLKNALLAKDLTRFFETVKASGRSSFCYLQNVFTTANVREQGLSLALCLAEQFFATRTGAFRVHGGGFAGTIQCFVKADEADELCALMDGVFGKGACTPMLVRREGAIRLA